MHLRNILNTLPLFGRARGYRIAAVLIADLKKEYNIAALQATDSWSENARNSNSVSGAISRSRYKYYWQNNINMYNKIEIKLN